MKRWFLVVGVLALLGAPASSAASDTSKRRQHVKVDAILKHMRALEGVADANGGTRASSLSLRAATRLHSPFRRAKASSVRAIGSTNQRNGMPAAA